MRGIELETDVVVVTVSPDGKLVAAGSLDTMVRVWNVATGHQVERLKGHKDSVYRWVDQSLGVIVSLADMFVRHSVAFSPDGTCLVSGSLDRTLRVWDLTATKRAVEGAGRDAKEPIDKGLGTCQSTLNGHKVGQPNPLY